MFLFPLVLLFFGLHRQAVDAVPPPQAYSDRDAYDVYSIVVPKEMVRQRGRTVYIQRQTVQGVRDGCMSTEKSFRDEYGELLENFTNANRAPVLLQRQFHLRKRYVLRDQDEIPVSAPSHVDGSMSFQHLQKFITVIHLSAVGFNADRTRALVMVEHVCGPSCGGGRYYFMVKSGQTWQIEPDFASQSEASSSETPLQRTISKTCFWSY
jgi:hypothetical protein